MGQGSSRLTANRAGIQGRGAKDKNSRFLRWQYSQARRRRLSDDEQSLVVAVEEE
jgi:hypothetical protein